MTKFLLDHSDLWARARLLLAGDNKRAEKHPHDTHWLPGAAEQLQISLGLIVSFLELIKATDKCTLCVLKKWADVGLLDTFNITIDMYKQCIFVLENRTPNAANKYLGRLNKLSAVRETVKK